MSRLRAVLLDVDGTLVDSNDAHAHAWVAALAESGHPTPFARVRPLIGKGGDKIIPELAGVSEEDEEGKRLSERRRAIFMAEWVPRLRSFAGAHDLVERMRRDGLRLVVATSANRQELEPLLRLVGAGDLLDAATSSDDADRSKPDPDIVGAALRKSGAPAADAMMLGDTPYDVEAAGRAGVAIVALRSGGWDDAALRDALAIYQDAADLLARYDSSPFGAMRPR